MKRVALAVLAALLLSGCLEPAPPDPMMSAVAARCQAGDSTACANYAQLRAADTQARQAAAAAVGQFRTQPLNPQDFMTRPAPVIVQTPYRYAPYGFGPGQSPYY